MRWLYCHTAAITPNIPGFMDLTPYLDNFVPTISLYCQYLNFQDIDILDIICSSPFKHTLYLKHRDKHHISFSMNFPTISQVFGHRHFCSLCPQDFPKNLEYLKSTTISSYLRPNISMIFPAFFPGLGHWRPGGLDLGTPGISHRLPTSPGRLARLAPGTPGPGRQDYAHVPRATWRKNGVEKWSKMESFNGIWYGI